MQQTRCAPKRQGPHLLTAQHSPQAKSLCDMLVQKGVGVNCKDVAWHSPEVMLEDVEKQMAEGFLLKMIYSQMWIVFAGSASHCLSGRCTTSI